jgi:hypothetical protein
MDEFTDEYKDLIIFHNSEAIQCFAEICNLNHTDAINNMLNIYNFGLDIDTCKRYILELIVDHKSIAYDDDNISYYVQLTEHYEINNGFMFHIVSKFILRKNKFYNILCNNEHINNKIIKSFEEHNKITNDTFEYLYKYNETLFQKAKSLKSLHINQQNLNKFTELTSLIIYNNSEIVDISHLVNTLERLDISDNCKLSEQDISQLCTLKSLHVTENPIIKNISYLNDTLIELAAGGNNCGIDQQCISQLTNLIGLHISGNPKITNINHLRNTLRVLVMDGPGCGIYENGINQLCNLKILKINNNPNITDVNYLKDTLRSLYITGDNCGVNQNGILLLNKLIELHVQDNSKITDVSNFKHVIHPAVIN